MHGAKGEIHLKKKLRTPQGKKPLGRYYAQNEG